MARLRGSDGGRRPPSPPPLPCWASSRASSHRHPLVPAGRCAPCVSGLVLGPGSGYLSKFSDSIRTNARPGPARACMPGGRAASAFERAGWKKRAGRQCPPSPLIVLIVLSIAPRRRCPVRAVTSTASRRGTGPPPPPSRRMAPPRLERAARMAGASWRDSRLDWRREGVGWGYPMNRVRRREDGPSAWRSLLTEMRRGDGMRGGG
jgi:hypothetical protein